jgi:PilZ domain
VSEDYPVQNAILLGMELSPLEIGAVGIFGILMAAGGYFVARTGRAAKTAGADLAFPVPEGMGEMTGPGSEQRLHPRFETQPFRLRLSLSQGGHEIEGLVLNQSLGGLCICVPQNLPEGSILNLRGSENTTNRIKSQVVIKHCRPHRGGWALGCQYV